MKVIPPNFGYVEEGIFRCGAPEPRHYGFLASLGLRTCILLTDTHDGAFVHWLQETGVMIFCPLSSEAQLRGNLRGGPQAYSSASVSDNMSFAQQGREGAALRGAPSTSGGNGGGGGTNMSNGVYNNATGNTNNNNNRDDGRDDAILPSGGGFGDNFGPGNGSGRFGPADGPRSSPNNNNANSNLEGNDGGGGVDGGYEGSGNFNGDDAYNGNGYNNNNSILSNGGGGDGGGGGRGGLGATNAGTSNALRFLRENVAERRISTKFSPVLVQEPVYFFGGTRNAAGGGGGDGPSQFVSAPSYEGRLHGLMTLSEAVVVSILHILLDPHYYPLLITCSKGRYRSGIVCGCLRKLQGWNLVSILEEYRRFADNKSRADNEEFIELFDEELVNLELPGGRKPTILYNM